MVCAVARRTLKPFAQDDPQHSKHQAEDMQRMEKLAGVGQNGKKNREMRKSQSNQNAILLLQSIHDVKKVW